MPEKVVPHLPHQVGGDPQFVQRQTGVGYRPAGGKRGRSGLDQTAGQEDPVEGFTVFPRKVRVNIQANMTSNYRIEHYPTPLAFQRLPDKL